MNILMLGDSYGVPDWPMVAEGTANGNHHISRLLANAGHNVYNVSVNGSSNLQAIDRAESLLDGNTVCDLQLASEEYTELTLQQDTNIDYIIWMCTSLLRDRDKVDATLLYSQLSELRHLTYNGINNILQKIPNAKLIAIGGAAPLDPFALNSYLQVHYCVPDWRAELLAMKATDHLSSAVPSLLDLDVRADNLSKHITLAEAVISNMQSSNLFPDGCHPGAEAHKDLYDRISSILQ